MILKTPAEYNAKSHQEEKVELLEIAELACLVVKVHPEVPGHRSASHLTGQVLLCPTIPGTFFCVIATANLSLASNVISIN